MNDTKTFESEVRELIVSTVLLFKNSDEERMRGSINRFLEAYLGDKKNTEEQNSVIKEAIRRINSYSFDDLNNIEEAVKKLPSDEDTMSAEETKEEIDDIDRMIEELLAEVKGEKTPEPEPIDERLDEFDEDEDDEEEHQDSESFYDRIVKSSRGTKFILVDDKGKEDNYYLLGHWYIYGGEAVLMSKNKNPDIKNSICFMYEEELDALSLVENEEDIERIKDRVNKRL